MVRPTVARVDVWVNVNSDGFSTGEEDSVRLPRLGKDPSFTCYVCASFPLAVESGGPVKNVRPVEVRSSTLVYPTSDFVKGYPRGTANRGEVEDMICPGVFRSNSVSLVMLAVRGFNERGSVVTVDGANCTNRVHQVIVYVRPIGVNPKVGCVPLLEVVVQRVLVGDEVPTSFIPVAPGCGEEVVCIASGRLPLWAFTCVFVVDVLPTDRFVGGGGPRQVADVRRVYVEQVIEASDVRVRLFRRRDVPRTGLFVHDTSAVQIREIAISAFRCGLRAVSVGSIPEAGLCHAGPSTFLILVW